MSAERLVARSLGDGPLVLGDAVVVVGGPSPAGNRRARQLVVRAAETGRRVVWIDACGEHRVDGDGDGGLAEVMSGAGLTSGAGVIEWVSAADALDERLQRGRLWRAAGRVGAWRDAKLVRRRGRLRGMFAGVASTLRRFARLGRGVGLWRSVDAQLDAAAGPPAAIVHTDEVSVTTAWHLARRYRDVPAGDDIPAGLCDGRGVS